MPKFTQGQKVICIDERPKARRNARTGRMIDYKGIYIVDNPHMGTIPGYKLLSLQGIDECYWMEESFAPYDENNFAENILAEIEKEMKKPKIIITTNEPY